MKLKELLQTGYYRNVLTLMTGTSLAQVILLLFTPIITRVFTPDELGSYAFFLSVIQLASVIVTGNYEKAIILPRRDEEAMQLFIISFLLALLSCLLILILFPLIDLNITHYLTAEQFHWYWILPLGVFILVMLQALNFLINRIKYYRQLAVSRVSGSASTAIISIILKYFFGVGEGLIWGKLIGLILESGVLVQSLRTRFQKEWKRCMHWGELKKVMRKYINYPLYSIPESFLNMGFKQIPILALTAYFSPALAGLYSLAQSVIQKPLGTLSYSFGQVFFQKAAEVNNEGKEALRRLFLRDVGLLAIIGFFPGLIIMLAGPWLFALIFGAAWEVSGVYARWIMPFIFITLLKSPVSGVVDIKNKIRENLIFEALFFIVALIAFYMGVQTQNALLGVQLFGIGCTLVGVLQLIWFYYLTGTDFQWEE